MARRERPGSRSSRAGGGGGPGAAKKRGAGKAAPRGGARKSPAPAPRRRAPAAPREATPKTTRPEAAKRREPEPERSAAQRIGRKLDAVPDRVDTRDWFFQPRLTALPDRVINTELVPRILDQGEQGACTGFALAACVNFLLRAQNVARSVSPYMLYHLARRYDEWPGERYEGSSARGAMKGWVRHGVCVDASWGQAEAGVDCLRKVLDRETKRTVAEEARGTPGGAFYRVMHTQVRDMHAALAEVGILYCTLMVHAGWSEPGPATVDVEYALSGNIRRVTLPVIARRGRATDGHAVAIVGYTSQGFIIQNSWGETWGAGGFALLPYEDFLTHATDVWVMQLGVPVAVDLWAEGSADTTAGLQRASKSVPLDAIRPFVVDVGNNGELSDTGDYWTTEADIERMFTETIPAKTAGWSKRRLMLYLHGGLNDERSVAARIVAFREVMLENEIYPVHIMWESGASETLNAILRDTLTDVDERAGGVGDWLRKVRDNVVEAKDRSLELTLARPGGALWREMKENARLSSEHPDGRGGVQLIARYARAALAGLDGGAKMSLELHVVGHSAGSIYAAYALPHLVGLGIPIRSLQLMAPAIRVDEFKARVLPLVGRGCPVPSLYVLSDAGERDDDVGPYGKSLLYLVSNSFEGRRETPLLGMERFVSTRGGDPAAVDPELEALFRRRVGGLPSLVVAGRSGGSASTSRSETHGGFDNDVDTMNSVLWRILGQRPKRPFTVRDLQY